MHKIKFEMFNSHILLSYSWERILMTYLKTLRQRKRFIFSALLPRGKLIIF